MDYSFLVFGSNFLLSRYALYSSLKLYGAWKQESLIKNHWNNFHDNNQSIIPRYLTNVDAMKWQDPNNAPIDAPTTTCFRVWYPKYTLEKITPIATTKINMLAKILCTLVSPPH